MSSVAVSLHSIKQNLRQTLSLNSALAEQPNPTHRLFSEAQRFTDYFDVQLATTPAQLERAFKLRYDVYCREFQYESPHNFPDGLERDDYDRQSIHCVIVHRELQLAAGCVRLVLPDGAQPLAPLPIERYCGESLTHPQLHPTQLPRQHLTEISRLAVHGIFRRRAGESRTPHGTILPKYPSYHTFDEAQRRTFPLIATALEFTALSVARLTDHGHLFAMMEPRLARLLKRVGLHFTQVGDLLDYHGQRAAFYLDTEQAAQNLKGDLRELFDMLNHTLSHEIDRHYKVQNKVS